MIAKVNFVRYLFVCACIFLFLCKSSHLRALDIDTSASWKNEDVDWTCRIKLVDINNDGYLDLVVANFIRGKGYTYDNNANIKIYKNKSGSIENVASQVLEMNDNIGSWNIALGDYDNDGDLDLAVGNIFEKNDLIFENNGGIFDEKPVWESYDKSVSHGLDWVDYDQDGDLDLSVSAAYSGVKIYENINGTLSNKAKWESFEALDFQDVDWADVDNDGDYDLAVANNAARPPGGIFMYKNDKGRMPSSILLVPNKAKKYLHYFGVSQVRTTSWMTNVIKIPARLAWGDLNNDGFPELAVANANGPTMVFENINGDLNEKPYWESFYEDGGSLDLIFADVDNDGLMTDTLLLNESDIRNVIYLPHQYIISIKSIYIDSEKITQKDFCYNLKDGWVSINKLLLKDVNKMLIEYIYSTDIDLVVAESNARYGATDKIFLNENGKLRINAGWESSGNTLSGAVAVGDIDNDGDIDIVFGGMPGHEGTSRTPQHIYLYKNRTVDNIKDVSIE